MAHANILMLVVFVAEQEQHRAVLTRALVTSTSQQIAMMDHVSMLMPVAFVEDPER